jgi:predicted membrane protein
MKIIFSKFMWGTLLLLTAVFILVNQLNGFASIGIGSIIAVVLTLAFILQCLINLHFAAIPIALAVFYIIFRTPLGLPYIQTWTVIIAAVFAYAGLSVLLPVKKNHRQKKYSYYCRSGDQRPQMRPESGNNDNNPVINVSFSALSRSLRADSLETAQLNCNFGSLEIFFDKVELNPRGAEIILNCSFGGIKMFIPKHWHIIDRLDCTLGGVDMDIRFAAQAENAPQLTLSGSVSFSGVEVRYI